MGKSKIQIISVLAIIVFSVIILCLTVFMTLKNTDDLKHILEESIESQLIAISIAARGLLDIDKFELYNSEEDIYNDIDAYRKTLEDLRSLQRQVGAAYIYALKLIGGKYYFIFDTDYESDTVIDEYELYPVHERAFLGEDSAGIMNLSDEYGNFNTGAVPIWKDDKIIGIISADIEDTYIHDSNRAAFNNSIALILSLIFTMGVMAAIVSLLLRNVRKMQDKLFQMANYDVLTGLPNRQYLMNYLPIIAEKSQKNRTPFALFLIDLDNFKDVNDNAGHDAGDELLRHIATYLNSIHENSKSFRPAAGILNISARIGGDEFVQIVPGVANEDEAEMIAKKVIDNFRSKTLDRFIEKYQVGLSIGVALFPYHTDNYHVLIKYADIAMYHSKKGGKNACRIYNDEMNQADSIERPKSNDRRQNRR